MRQLIWPCLFKKRCEISSTLEKIGQWNHVKSWLKKCNLPKIFQLFIEHVINSPWNLLNHFLWFGTSFFQFQYDFSHRYLNSNTYCQLLLLKIKTTRSDKKSPVLYKDESQLKQDWKVFQPQSDAKSRSYE